MAGLPEELPAPVPLVSLTTSTAAWAAASAASATAAVAAATAMACLLASNESVAKGAEKEEEEVAGSKRLLLLSDECEFVLEFSIEVFFVKLQLLLLPLPGL